jgi:hypothetical protein
LNVACMCRSQKPAVKTLKDHRDLAALASKHNV